MGIIEIYDATFSGITRDSSGRIVANPGDSIRCFFRLRNTGSTSKNIWWAVHDRYNDERLTDGTGFLSAGGSTSLTRYITMPDHQLNLEYWGGPTDGGSARVNFDPIYPIPQMGAINFVTTPAGATILVNYIYKGITSRRVEVQPGYYPVSVALTGYETESDWIRVSAGQTASFYAMLTKKPTDGTLAIGSSPHGAKIYVDGAYVGITPATQYKYITILAGSHTIKLTKDGYQDATTGARVDVGLTTYYNPVLEASTGQVYVTGEHLEGAEIYVDDVATGVLIPGTVTVSVGRHNIVAKKEV